MCLASPRASPKLKKAVKMERQSLIAMKRLSRSVTMARKIGWWNVATTGRMPEPRKQEMTGLAVQLSHVAFRFV